MQPQTQWVYLKEKKSTITCIYNTNNLGIKHKFTK